jgi:glutamyl/glutaminyl-tRNA synthetase
MSLNFDYSKKMGGKCIMRFDDTNPVTEKQEYIDNILEVSFSFKNLSITKIYKFVV